jgi:hypothetical protein
MGTKYIALTRKAGGFSEKPGFQPFFKPLTKFANHDRMRIVD